MTFDRIASAALITFAFTASALAQGPGWREPGTGPVVSACQSDIAAYCEGVEHVSAQGARGGVRACLVAHRAKLGAGCREALDTTGPGSGRGMRMRQ